MALFYQNVTIDGILDMLHFVAKSCEVCGLEMSGSSKETIVKKISQYESA